MTEVDKEAQAMQEELEHFRNERDKVRTLVGQIGGSGSAKRDKVINVAFIALVLLLFALDLLKNAFHVISWGFSEMVSMELAVLLVSLKIIWMIHQQSRVEHFQFWILNTIEFRLNALSKNLVSLHDLIEKKNDSPH